MPSGGEGKRMSAGLAITDTARLERWLGSVVPGVRGPLSVTKFPDGQSNPTYRIDTGGASFVLRRKPPGDLLPSAHAIDREYRVLGSLHGRGFPVPCPIAFCEDETVIGTAFFVMEMVEGRTLWDGTLPGLAPDARRVVYEAMVATLARLHSFDPSAVGLGDFGRTGNYVERQVQRWTKQYRATQTDDIPEMERLMEWLPRSIPEQSRIAVIHGDYRIDNIIFRPDAPQVAAVLDWELSTLGDPLADFAYFAMNWVAPSDGRAGVDGVDLKTAGIPTLDEICARYCEATGRSRLPHLGWYFAYNFFRLASIVQGIKKRMIEGNASSSQAADTVSRLERCVHLAWQQAQLAGAQ